MSVEAAINADNSDGEYEVVAKRGIVVDDTAYEKGDRLTLPRTIAQGLLRDKGIKEVSE